MGSPRDLYDTIVVASGGPAITADGDANEFDRLNGGNPVHDLVVVADVAVGMAGTDSAAITLKHGDSTDSMSAVESTQVQGDGAASEDGQYVLGYLGDKRFVTAAVDVTGSASVTVTYVAGNPRDTVR